MIRNSIAQAKPSTRWLLVPLTLLCLGMLLATPRHGASAGSEFVSDGSFEAGRNAGIWKESSVNFGTPICSFAVCGNGDDHMGSGPTALPRTGSFWAWFGGAGTTPEKSALAQNIKFPSGGKAKLRFYLWIGDASPDGKDFLKVFIDGQKVFAVKEGSTQYGSYTLVTKNVGQFADGAKHKIQFKNKCTGDGNATFNVDDVSITVD